MGKGGAGGLLRVGSRGRKQLGTYPGSRKARLSGAARVTVGSLGARKATGPSLSRGSLYKRRQGVSGRPLDSGCRKGPQPLFPTYLGTCQTILTRETTVARSTLGEARRKGSELEGPHLTVAAERLARLRGLHPTNRSFCGAVATARKILKE